MKLAEKLLKPRLLNERGKRNCERKGLESRHGAMLSICVVWQVLEQLKTLPQEVSFPEKLVSSPEYCSVKG